MKKILSFLGALAAMGHGPVAATSATRVLRPNGRSSGWCNSLPLTTGAARAMRPCDFGARYRPNQRKRRKLARRLGIHPANPHRR